MGRLKLKEERGDCFKKKMAILRQKKKADGGKQYDTANLGRKAVEKITRLSRRGGCGSKIKRLGRFLIGGLSVGQLRGNFLTFFLPILYGCIP